jgi:hypothetical protein
VDPGREELLPADDGYLMELFIEIKITQYWSNRFSKL